MSRVHRRRARRVRGWSGPSCPARWRTSAPATLFGWSLVAEQAAADVGAPGSAGAAVFAVSIAVFTAALLAAGRALSAVGPRRLLDGAAGSAATGLGGAAAVPHPLALCGGVGALFGTAS